ncbi:hypothetical protein M422DRAFT_37623, partial [Sphaerobolus stellatus SS14]
MGSDTLECSKVTSFGLPPDSVKTFKTLTGCNLRNACVQDLLYIHKKFGIDPDSNEAARLLGLPLIEICQLENKESGSEAGHSSDLYEESRSEARHSSDSYGESGSEAEHSSDSYHTADNDEHVDC